MTVINYIDRQTINVLAPILKKEHQWTNSDFAWLLISFRVAYTIMQSVNGRLLDRFGTRLGLTVSVAFYSAVQMLTTTGQRSVIARIPMNLMYASVVLGFAFATLFPVLGWLGARPGADHADVER